MTTLTAAVRPTRSHLLVHSGLLTLRSVRALIRQPWYAAITLIQPVIWLLLFGQLFRSVVHIPGFVSSQDASGSYLEFISPGVPPQWFTDWRPQVASPFGGVAPSLPFTHQS